MILPKGADLPDESVGAAPSTVCRDCRTYQELLRETVAVLEKTTRAFKSTDLGRLRRRLERLLAGTEAAGCEALAARASEPWPKGDGTSREEER